jgi:maltose/maltodextrin transport system substrate-binding protein
VRPGEPGKRPFWNSRAVKFIHAPAFDFKPVQQATLYRFTATSVVDGKDYIFTAQQPWAALTEVWRRLPIGYVQLKVEALDRQGRVIELCGAKEFYKDAAFAGPYQCAALDYRASALAAWAHLFKQPHVQTWAQTGEPDPTYPLYCYPAKVIGAVVSSMAHYARLAPADSTQAIAIAKNAADYLIRISQPSDRPLAYFPPTYHGEQLTAGAYAGQIMIPYAAEAAMYYLDLFDAINDTSYLQAALRIADRAAVMESGKIALEGAASDLAGDPRIVEAYLGGHVHETSGEGA